MARDAHIQYGGYMVYGRRRLAGILVVALSRVLVLLVGGIGIYFG